MLSCVCRGKENLCVYHLVLAVNMEVMWTVPHPNVHYIFSVVLVDIDIERRVIDVIENQTFVEVCLVKSGPSTHPIMALVNAEETTGNVGSPGEAFSMYESDCESQ